MDQFPVLLPAPRHASMGAGIFALTDGKLITLHSAEPQALLPAARRIQQALVEYGVAWEVSASPNTPAALVGLELAVNPHVVAHPQGYRLTVGPEGGRITGHDPAGVFYGVGTLIQVLQQSGTELPYLSVEDHPDFLQRGVMLDISRDKVYKMETLFELVDLLSSWKINQLQLYTEHTFAYRHHPAVWAEASPMTAGEILALDHYARERFVELVPNQNSFGHMERWFKHPRYLPYAEVQGTFRTPWGAEMGPFSLCAIDPASFDLIQGLYDELLPNFSSRYFNVGCDETWDLGAGRSKAAVEQKGSGRVYMEYLLELYRDVTRRGKTMMFWGDIIIQHPELVPELPRDLIALEWGYDADHPFEQHSAAFAASGIPFYVCPGTSSWNTVAGRTDNALANIRSAAENGLKFGACGLLNTDWGDNGHWQVLPVSYLGFAAGAAYSWNLEGAKGMDIARALSLFAFADSASVLGQVYYDLGNVYRAAGYEPGNASVLFHLLQLPLEEIRNHSKAPELRLDAAELALETAVEMLPEADLNHPRAGLIVKETLLVIQMLRHAIARGRLALETDSAKITAQKTALLADLHDILPKFREVWLGRARPGGLQDSIARLEKLLPEYQV